MVEFWSGNYLTYKVKSDQSGGSPRCRICSSGCDETTSHIISTCIGLESVRDKILPEFRGLAASTKNQIHFDELGNSEIQFCQFILDPSSLNRQTQVSLMDPILKDFVKLSRDFCFLIDKTRVKLLKELKENSE